MDEIFCVLAYPTFVVCSAVWYSLLRWSSTRWCEHMWGTPADNRVVIGLLHSPRWLDFISWWVFFRAWAYVLFILSKLLHLLTFQLYPVGIVVCLVLYGWR